MTAINESDFGYLENDGYKPEKVLQAVDNLLSVNSFNEIKDTLVYYVLNANTEDIADGHKADAMALYRFLNELDIKK